MYNEFGQVSKGDEFMQLSLPEVLEYITDDDVNIGSEDPVLSCLQSMMNQ